ncbi:MAG: T9SS type A sorting domain-containing protein [Chitinophagaceae bacterium]|nr:T9SS type A sorting domain-containing protein [Chitinophagaceae bacterium]
MPIPDGTGVAATSNLTIAGIPANATITEIKVNMNINHTWVGDVDVNLRAPNNAILNLVGGLDGGTGGNSTDNFTNTAFSSIGGATISGAPAPRTGTFAAEARAGFGPIGYIQTVATWAGLVPPATPTAANGQWTLAMGDFVGTDIGALTNWSITIDYTTPGGGGGPTLTYVWSPQAGLYTNATATTPYTGGNTPNVYAAPTAQTLYTVRATDVATGCFTDATVLVNYTPPAPTVVPSSVTMCLGDPAVKLKSSSSQAFSSTFNSGTLALAIPDGPASWPQTVFPGVVTPNLPVSGIPANATITGMSVKLNLTHTYIADMVIVLKAPNGQVFNLDANINKTGGAGANFINTIISSASTTPLSAGAPPYTGTFRADAVGATYVAVGFTFPGGPTSPAGYIPTVTNFNGLYSVPNGNWTLGMYDWGLGDLGTLTNWELKFDYIIGVPATPAVWSPAAGLFSDAAAAVPYVAGTAVDSVWTRPTPAGVYTYQATVQNLITTAATVNTPMAGGNGNNLVAFNVRNNNPYPVTFASIASNTFGSGAVVSRVFYKPTPIAGAPGAISAANGWTQFGTANNNVVANTLNQLMTGLTLSIPAGATYGIALDLTGATFPAYTNGAGIVTYSNSGCDIITGGNVGWGGPAAPGVPVNNPRNFNGQVVFLGSGAGTCTSPARTVIVTVHQPTTVTTQPANQTICTDKVATFTAAGGGSGPFSYQWQVSTAPCGNNPPCYTNITNGGVYSGATSATLTITQPPVSMSGNFYRVIITGAAPCAAATSNGALLTVNPLPIVVISASPYTSLFPGLVTTLSSTVTPNAAATYTWLRNGVAVAGATGATLNVDIDGLGDYQLRVTDVNNCTNSSNIITIKDSVSGKCFIYPNPTSGKFQVRYYSVANNVLPRTLTIYDAKGDRVFTQYYTIGRPYDRMDVDMRAYGKGLYWVEIGDLNGNRLTMCRVVIQ